MLPFRATNRLLKGTVVAGGEGTELAVLVLAGQTTPSRAGGLFTGVVMPVPVPAQAMVGAKRLGELAANRAGALAPLDGLTWCNGIYMQRAIFFGWRSSREFRYTYGRRTGALVKGWRGSGRMHEPYLRLHAVLHRVLDR